MLYCTTCLHAWGIQQCFVNTYWWPIKRPIPIYRWNPNIDLMYRPGPYIGLFTYQLYFSSYIQTIFKVSLKICLLHERFETTNLMCPKCYFFHYSSSKCLYNLVILAVGQGYVLLISLPIIFYLILTASVGSFLTRQVQWIICHKNGYIFCMFISGLRSQRARAGNFAWSWSSVQNWGPELGPFER